LSWTQSAEHDRWRRRADDLATATGHPAEHLWEWCAALAVVLVPSASAYPARVSDLLALGT
jgi:hypothetical protein